MQRPKIADCPVHTLQRCRLFAPLDGKMPTSVEHLATASANFSIGLVLPGIFDCNLQPGPGKSERSRSVADVGE